MTKIVTTRAKAFSSETARTYDFRVDADGTVSVLDSVAGHYTTCHALSARAQKRIAAMAAMVAI